MKICNKCGMEQPVTNFHKNSNTRDGLQRICKECTSAHNKAYNESHVEQNKAYKAAHREKNNARKKAYNEAHRAQNIEYLKQYRAEHSEEARTYRAEHGEARRDYNSTYRKEHSESILQQSKVWRDNNKDMIRKTTATWSKTHPEVMKVYWQTRRAKKAVLASTLTPEQWKHILDKFNNSCAYCGAGDKTLHQEYFIPLSAKGEYTHDNIIPACRSCNSSKGTKDFFGWYPKSSCYDKQREKKIMRFLHYTGAAQQLTLWTAKE